MSDAPTTALEAAVEQAEAEATEKPITVPFCGVDFAIGEVAPIDVFRFFGSAGNIRRFRTVSNDILETAIVPEQRSQLEAVMRTGGEQGHPPSQIEILAFVRAIVEADALRPTTP